jgi:hypothetical protein
MTSCLLLCPIFLGRHACICFEEAGECSWVGKAKLLADLLDVEVGAVAK